MNPAILQDREHTLCFCIRTGKRAMIDRQQDRDNNQ